MTPGPASPGTSLARTRLGRAPCDALVIVPVNDAYISPSWYPSKAEHGRVVPTWNYEVAHVNGQLVAHDDADWVSDLVRALTDRHESGLPQPWSVDDAPPDYTESMLRAIVGIEIEITRLVGKRKLSQNRPPADQAGSIEGLRSRRHARSDTVADAMESPPEDR